MDDMHEYLEDLVMEYIALAEVGEADPADLTNAVRELEAVRQEMGLNIYHDQEEEKEVLGLTEAESAEANLA